MLLWYYGNSISKSARDRFQSLQSTASQGRKIFRLLKSVDCVNNIFKLLKLKKISSSSDEQLIRNLEIIAQALWAVFYAYDNLLLFARARIISNDQYELNRRSNIAWFGADVVTLCTHLYKYKLHLKDYNTLLARSRSASLTSNNSVQSDDANSVRQIQKELAIMKRTHNKFMWYFFKVSVQRVCSVCVLVMSLYLYVYTVGGGCLRVQLHGPCLPGQAGGVG